MTAVTQAPAADLAAERRRQDEVIRHAREVLERAHSEYETWHGSEGRLRAVTAMAVLEGALNGWTQADPADLQAADQAVRAVAWKTLQLVRIYEDVMGDEAAAYVSGATGGEGE